MINRNLIPLYPYGQKYLDLCQPDLTKQPNPPRSPPSECYSLESQMDQFTKHIDPYAMSFPRCVDNAGNLRNSQGAYGDHIAKTFAKAQASYRKRTLGDSMALHESLHQSEVQDETFKSLLSHLTNEEDYFPKKYQACEEEYVTEYLNRKDVQAALHANLKRSSWSMCANINYSDYDFATPMLSYYLENSKLAPQVKTLVFSGTDDTMCSTFEAQMAFFNNFKVESNWKDVLFEGQLVGQKTTFVEPAAMTFITVGGAGHMAPSTRPAHTKYIIEAFVQGKL